MFHQDVSGGYKMMKNKCPKQREAKPWELTSKLFRSLMQVSYNKYPHQNDTQPKDAAAHGMILVLVLALS